MLSYLIFVHVFFSADLDAEEEFENAAKRRNREERKRQERLKKLQMAEHLGVIPGKRDELIAPQSGMFHWII